MFSTTAPAARVWGEGVTDFLVRRIAQQPSSLAARIALGLGCAALAIGIRVVLSPFVGGLGAPFGLFVLIVLVASVFGGTSAGVACVAVLCVGGLALMAPAPQPLWIRRVALGMGLFLASSAFVIWIVTLLRTALSREMAAREGERLLKLELHHRVKNTLAVVQAMADQTFRSASDTTAARHDFTARLIALAAAHDLLMETSWRDVTLTALAERVLAPFRPADPDRLIVEGEPISIPPEAAVALGLCLHELATNAAKHGALSGDAGHVQLSWRMDETSGRRRLELDWRESGGPAPLIGGRQGFGSRLLTQSLAAQPGAAANLSLEAAGARWTAGFEL